jgi:hypothetical protein
MQQKQTLFAPGNRKPRLQSSSSSSSRGLVRSAVTFGQSSQRLHRVAFMVSVPSRFSQTPPDLMRTTDRTFMPDQTPFIFLNSALLPFLTSKSVDEQYANTRGLQHTSRRATVSRISGRPRHPLFGAWSVASEAPPHRLNGQYVISPSPNPA